jgi:hypothetical protein
VWVTRAENGTPVLSSRISLPEKHWCMTPDKREALAKQVIHRFTALEAKLTDFDADIRSLWKEFDGLKRGEKILGCTNRKQFCENHLHRTPRAVQYMLSGGNPTEKRNGFASAKPLPNDVRRQKCFGADCEERHAAIVKTLQEKLPMKPTLNHSLRHEPSAVEWAPLAPDADNCAEYSPDEDRYRVELVVPLDAAEEIAAALRQPRHRERLRDQVAVSLRAGDPAVTRQRFETFLRQVAQDLGLQEDYKFRWKTAGEVKNAA